MAKVNLFFASKYFLYCLFLNVHLRCMQKRSVTESTSPGCENAPAGAILIRGILN